VGKASSWKRRSLPIVLSAAAKRLPLRSSAPLERP
jgi:hypothetical protein